MIKKFNKEINKKEEEFDQRVIDVARVTRVMAGGKRMKFRVCLAIGDKKGRVGFGVAKGNDVIMGITKALARAKKNIIKVPLKNETIIHPINYKFKAAKIILKPARQGNGIKAGGAVRTICELAGIPNITAKILGSNNKINNVKVTIKALSSFKIEEKKDKDKDLSDKKKEKKIITDKDSKDKSKK